MSASGEAARKRGVPILSADALAALAVVVAGRVAAFVVAVTVAPKAAGATTFARRLDRVWALKDSGSFVSIARHGYVQPNASAFLPGYPLALRAVALLTGGDYPLAGVLLSLVCYGVAMILLYRLTAAELDTRAAALAVALVSVFPTAAAFGLAYSESLFLLACLAAFFFARRDRWALAGAAGLLAVATRSTGLVLLPALLVLYGQQRGWSLRHLSLRRSDLRLAWLALVPLGLLAYMAYLWWRLGDPLAFSAAEHAHWRRSLAWPWVDPLRAFHASVRAEHLLAAHHAGLERLLLPVRGVPDPLQTLFGFATLVAAVVGVALVWRFLPAAYTVFAAGSVLVPLLYPSTGRALYSFPRFVGVAFPLFMVAGLVLRRRPVLAWVVIGCSFVGLLWLTRGFVLGTPSL